MLIKCEECGKFFGGANSSDSICTSCKEGQKTGLKHIKDPKEQRFVTARNLVYENPDISPEALVNIMRNMGIDITIKEIMSYVRQGRLTLKNAEVHNLCEDCGKKILSGRKCPTCTNKFVEEMSKAKTDFNAEMLKELGDMKVEKNTAMHSQY